MRLARRLGQYIRNGKWDGCLFGKGKATGSITFYPTEDTSNTWKASTSNATVTETELKLRVKGSYSYASITCGSVDLTGWSKLHFYVSVAAEKLQYQPSFSVGNQYKRVTELGDNIIDISSLSGQQSIVINYNSSSNAINGSCTITQVWLEK